MISRLVFVFLFIAGASGFAQTQPFTCTSAGGSSRTVIAGGLTELLEDFVVVCTGGTPAAAGTFVPSADISLTVSAEAQQDRTWRGVARFSSAITAQLLWSEALLFVDEPNNLYGAASPRPLLNCGAPGAPDVPDNAVGVCRIVAPADPQQTYDGTNVWDTGQCRCGRPNVFQGRHTPPSNSMADARQIVFRDVPLNPPGDGQQRILRFKNIRVNTAAVLAANDTVLRMKLSFDGSMAPQYVQDGPRDQIGWVRAGGLSVSSEERVVTSPIRFREINRTDWKVRNPSLRSGDNLGTPGNGTYTPQFLYNGGTYYPVDVANPGLTERSFTQTGFLWQNNYPNGPPIHWDGGAPLWPPAGGPLINWSQNTGIASSGLALAGTRIAINFTNIPAGAVVELPPTVELAGFDGFVSKGRSGVLALTSTDSRGAGPYSPRSGFFTSDDHLAVYEVLFESPYIDLASIPFKLTNAPAGTALKVSIQLAPFYADPIFGFPISVGHQLPDAPVPRYVDNNFLVPCMNIVCLKVSPSAVPNDAPAVLTFSGPPDAINIPALKGAKVKLTKTAFTPVPEIQGTNVTNPTDGTLQASFNLTGAGPGWWDARFTTPDGRSFVIQWVLQVQDVCQWQLTPRTFYVPWWGGKGEFQVTAAKDNCPWTATTGYSWIKLLPPVGNIQPFYVQPNSSPDPRTAEVGVGGNTLVGVIQGGR